ncbi:hypothetical protein D3C73_1048570 [compost metagenome]
MGRKVGFSIVDDLVSAKSSDEIMIIVPRGCDNICSMLFGQLDGYMSHSSGARLNKNTLSRLKMTMLKQCLPSCQGNRRSGTCLFKGETFRDHGKMIFFHRNIVHIRTSLNHAYNTIPRFELSHFPTNLLNDAGYFITKNHGQLQLIQKFVGHWTLENRAAAK